MKNLIKSRYVFLESFSISNSSVGNAAAAKGSSVWNVSFLIVAIVLRISRSSRKSLLCKAGTANSRNTCVDMRLACVACRPLGRTRASLLPPPGSLGISLAPLHPHAFLLRACIHAWDVSFTLSLLQLCCCIVQCSEFFSEHAEVELSQISVRADSPCLRVRHSAMRQK